MARVRVGSTTDVPPGEGRVVEADGRTLALFNVSGAFYALDNSCSHRGGPLGEGDLDGPVVVMNNPAVKMACFPVSLEGDQVWVDLP